MRNREPAQRHDKLAVRLSVIIIRLLTGETLSLKALSDEFGVSERTLRRDFHQRLIHLDILGNNGIYRLSENPLRDHSPGAFSFIRNTGIAQIIPSQSRQLMHLLMDESGTSPCLIWHSPQPMGTSSDRFVRLVEAIHHHRTISLLVKGIRHDQLEPYRLIYQHQHWYLVSSQRGAIHVFKLEEVLSVSLTDQHFHRRNEIGALITEEGFINALPHFHFISNVIHTFREQHPGHQLGPKGVK